MGIGYLKTIPIYLWQILELTIVKRIGDIYHNYLMIKCLIL